MSEFGQPVNPRSDKCPNSGYTGGVRLSDYLAERGESVAAFAGRSDLPRTTVHRVLDGCEPRTTNAIKIIKATGGLVALEDLRPFAAASEILTRE